MSDNLLNIFNENEQQDKNKSVKSSKKFYQPSSESAERYFVDSNIGLNSAQVKSRIEQGHINHSVDSSSKSVSKIILTNVFTYFNIIFFVLAALLVIEQSYNHLTFLIVVFFNTVIGIFQEIRAKKTLEKLTLVSAPMA